MTHLDVRTAQERILARFEPVGTEQIPLDQSAGRVLATDILASDLPPFDNSSVDGFAVLASDLEDASASSPRTLPVVADIPAGSNPSVRLRAGEAARIMTGAPLPAGANAVIMLEDTDAAQRGSAAAAQAPAQVQARKSVHSGENVRTRGMDVRQGERVLAAGLRLRPQDVGMLAMLGVGKPSVFKKPRAALLSSGSELVSVDQPLEPGQIHDTNTYTIGALVTESGYNLLPLGVTPDDRQAIQALFERAAESHANVIISSAGVSVGALDFVKDVVESQGTLDFWRVNMRPGKPLAFGEYRGIPFFGLPGNPVSAFVGFEVFVRPALQRLAGIGAGGPAIVPTRSTVRVQLAEPVESDGRETYLRAVLEQRDGVWWARLTGHQGSGNLLSLVRANSLLIIPAGVKSLAIGAQADAWLL